MGCCWRRDSSLSSSHPADIDRDSASEIRLTWDSGSAAAGALKIERRQPGGAFREIASVAPGAGGFTDSGLPGGAVFQYRIRAEGPDGTVDTTGEERARGFPQRFVLVGNVRHASAPAE